MKNTHQIEFEDFKKLEWEHRDNSCITETPFKVVNGESVPHITLDSSITLVAYDLNTKYFLTFFVVNSAPTKDELTFTGWKMNPDFKPLLQIYKLKEGKCLDMVINDNGKIITDSVLSFMFEKWKGYINFAFSHHVEKIIC